MQLHVYPDDLPYIMCASASVLMRTNKTIIKGSRCSGSSLLLPSLPIKFMIGCGVAGFTVF